MLGGSVDLIRNFFQRTLVVSALVILVTPVYAQSQLPVTTTSLSGAGRDTTPAGGLTLFSPGGRSLEFGRGPDIGTVGGVGDPGFYLPFTPSSSVLPETTQRDAEQPRRGDLVLRLHQGDVGPAGLASGNDEGNADRNQNYALQAVAGAGLGQGVEVFLEPSFYWVEDSDSMDAGDVGLDDGGYALRAGFSTQLTDSAWTEFGVGYFNRPSYADDEVAKNGFVLSGALVWHPSDLARLTLRGAQAVDTMSLDGLTEAMESQVSAGFGYRLSEGLNFNSAFSFQDRVLAGETKSEETWQARAGFVYGFGDSLSLDLAYQVERRKSEEDKDDSLVNGFFLTIKSRF